MNGYETLRQMATEAGVRVPDLLAMHRSNDPFYCGSPAQVEQARWFVALIDRYSFAYAFHLRRVHYRIVSEREPVSMVDGRPYQNTERCWSYLCNAGKAARTLGLLDARRFVDQRNPAPSIYREEPSGNDPSIWLPEIAGLELPGIDAELAAPDFDLPEPEVLGYRYSGADQPYLLEVWIEKTTQNDILRPLCQRFGMNLVPAAGFQSITAAVNLIDRVRQTGKPGRVLYVSDFDPAGDKMPIAVARQVEYHLQATPADVSLHRLALTAEQVAAYDLPRIPIKESDLRRANFEAKHGTGAVELDALEALHPGTLKALVTDAARGYFDTDLPELAADTEAEAQAAVELEWRDRTAEERTALDGLRTEAATILNRYRPMLQTLAADLDANLEPLRQQADIIAEAVRDKARDFDPDLPPRAESDLEPPDESAWLFDSRRGYFDQLAAYANEKGPAAVTTEPLLNHPPENNLQPSTRPCKAP
ncbi:hypothetical protein CKO42_25655 [Lamprobacter modestohalophilus]|uniref:Toprim domain-containing protein n=1 Tax=Lamprobacter modestohalophilus TaxID=1064514 RepID=A0A9X0WDW3_9GAMM|nr:hypothetical protein [Lamprobacter modestohalophilus]MBK1621713.1 hypothetical protein [Lamprobacter modestohalophilus]